MFEKIKMFCIGNRQTHTDKKIASFIVDADLKDCKIKSISVTYESGQNEKPIFVEEEFYKLHVPKQNSTEIEEPKNQDIEDK